MSITKGRDPETSSGWQKEEKTYETSSGWQK